MRLLYSTNASKYQKQPVAVAMPQGEADLSELIGFSNHHGVGLIPRIAGTSFTVMGRDTGYTLDH